VLTLHFAIIITSPHKLKSVSLARESEINDQNLSGQ